MPPPSPSPFKHGFKQIPMPITIQELDHARADPDPDYPAPDSQAWVIRWSDSRGNRRSILLGPHLYEYKFTFHDGQQEIARTVNDDAWGHPGFGYVVSHDKDNTTSPFGKQERPQQMTKVFSGDHHMVHRVETTYRRGDEHGIEIPVVIDWFIATGRDHPVWAVNWRVGQASNPDSISFDDYLMDVRGPYGSLNFDGAATKYESSAIAGVAWGDYKFQFTSAEPDLTDTPVTSEALTLNSQWTYDTPNSGQVNFTELWTADTNAAMGIVQTIGKDPTMGYPDWVCYHERKETSLSFTNKGDCSDPGYIMPCINGWPYQLVNYDWAVLAPDESTTGKLIAWGSPYGWLGAKDFYGFDAFDALPGDPLPTSDGTGDRCYATFIVLGPRRRYSESAKKWDRRDGEVARAIKSVVALNAAQLSASVGSVPTWVPRGPGSSSDPKDDLAFKSITNGYNGTYAVFCITADHNRARFDFEPTKGAIDNPIFVIENFTPRTRITQVRADLPQITVDGTLLNISDSETADAFVSIDVRQRQLWITLRTSVSKKITVEITP